MAVTRSKPRGAEESHVVATGTPDVVQIVEASELHFHQPFCRRCWSPPPRRSCCLVSPDSVFWASVVSSHDLASRERD